MLDIVLRVIIGGIVVSAFAGLGDALKPKSFAGRLPAWMLPEPQWGSIGLIVFAVVLWQLLPRHSLLLVLLVAMAARSAVSFSVWFGRKKLCRRMRAQRARQGRPPLVAKQLPLPRR